MPVLDFNPLTYHKIFEIKSFDSSMGRVYIKDNLGGFDKNLENPILRHINDHAQNEIEVQIHYYATDELRSKYPNLAIIGVAGMMSLNSATSVVQDFHNYNYKFSNSIPTNYLCSISGSYSIGRALMCCGLEKTKLLTNGFFSKPFTIDIDQIDQFIIDQCGEDERYYRKFFINDDGIDFYQKEHTIGDYVKASYLMTNRVNYTTVMEQLSSAISSSFITLISESHPESYLPNISEKELYPSFNKKLFLVYGQPGWYKHVQATFGYKPYSKIFNHDFDLIENPVIRAAMIIWELNKYANLSKLDWHDLYLIEKDSIEFNYDLLRSGESLKNHHRANIEQNAKIGKREIENFSYNKC